MRVILILIFLVPITTLCQSTAPQRIKGQKLFARTVHPEGYLPGGGGGASPTNYEIIEANSALPDTAIDGIGCIQMHGDSAAVIGGWDASFGLPYTRNSVYIFRLSDYTRIAKVQAQWSPRHSFGYGTGGTGYGYVVGGDWQPEATAQSRREVWRTSSNTTPRFWTRQTTAAGWNDSLCLSGFTIQPDSIAGIDTLFFAGGQLNYDLSKGISPNVYRSVDAGVTWSLFATNSRFFGGNNNGCIAWFPKIRKFVLLKGAKYDNDFANRTYADSVFVADPTLTTFTFCGRLSIAIQYPQMCAWDDRVWIVDGSVMSTNYSNIYTLNWNSVLTEMTITTLVPLHATSLAVDPLNDRLIIACGNLVKNVWYIQHVAL